MTVRVRQVTRTTQPQEAAGIDFSPLTAGLVFAHAGTELTVRDPQFNVIGSWTTNGAESSSPVYVTTTERGTAIHVTHDYAELSTDISDSDSWTFFAIGRTTANGVAPLYSRTLIHRGRDSFGDGWSANIGVDNNGKAVALVILTSGGAAGFSATGTTTINDGAWHAVCGTYSTSTNELKIYVDGVCEATTSTTKTGLRSSTKKLSLGLAGLSSSETTDASWYGDALAFSVHNRALLPSEVASISANPWQLFEPEQIVVKAGAAGTSTTTVTVDAGSLTLTGQAVTDTVTAAVDAGTVTLTGQNVALQQQQPVTAGSTPLTGQSIGITITVPISPGTLSLTGSSVTVVPPSGSSTVTVDPGTLSLTGQAVTNLVTTPVSAGSTSLTGQNIGVTTTVNVSPGSITLTGQVVTVSYLGTQTIPVEPGTISVTGRDVTVSVTGGTKGGAGKGKNLTLKQKKKLKAVVSQEWLKAEQTVQELLLERLGHTEPAKVRVEKLTTVQSLADVIAALQALSKETVTLPEQQAVIKSFEKSIDTKVIKTGERLVAVEDKVNETLGRIEKKIQNLEDLLIVVINELL